jgi:hypothetical protein
MSENMRVIVEVVFNISYLIVMWGLVILMKRRWNFVAPEDLKIVKRIWWMFFLLALGDSGHVGFRVIAYARGGLEANPALVGIGALATAITITFFYMLLVDVWRIRFNKKIGSFGIFLLISGIIRLVVMALPGNDWGSVIPPQPMGIIRNLFLMVQGIGIMALIVIESYRQKERVYFAIGACIFFSFLFYTPVILWVDKIPLLGMLMIPKTLAYVAVAIIVYKAYFRHPSTDGLHPVE